MQGLGSLEAVVMKCLWAHDDPQPVRTVHEHISEDRDIAYTTVMTVMDNLHRKGMVTRTRVGRAYHYLPAQTREEYTASLLEDALADGGDRQHVLMHFVDRLDSSQLDALRRALGRAEEGATR
ncbi:BlaI/MecI/CopY family transcriptional regulator [Nocardioides rotundus]|uniref:BlaI/MecI/CopY family transcriptional regulator n=1 Tax=Nocardioides rotundus TaxID=1774216 RepID=UPI001CBACEC8|nr:BlaI/MecI/CopY family transcriptional regulator [Nocardioides rotundus]